VKLRVLNINQINQDATDASISSNNHPGAAPAVFLFLFSQFRVTSEKSQVMPTPGLPELTLAD
jgi:hypothetical protein